jgi:hypothetical protein
MGWSDMRTPVEGRSADRIGSKCRLQTGSDAKPRDRSRMARDKATICWRPHGPVVSATATPRDSRHRN